DRALVGVLPAEDGRVEGLVLALGPDGLDLLRPRGERQPGHRGLADVLAVDVDRRLRVRLDREVAEPRDREDVVLVHADAGVDRLLDARDLRVRGRWGRALLLTLALAVEQVEPARAEPAEHEQAEQR